MLARLRDRAVKCETKFSTSGLPVSAKVFKACA